MRDRKLYDQTAQMVHKTVHRKNMDLKKEFNSGVELTRYVVCAAVFCRGSRGHAVAVFTVGKQTLLRRRATIVTAASSVEATENDDDGDGKTDEQNHEKQRHDCQADGEDVRASVGLVIGRVSWSSGLHRRR